MKNGIYLNRILIIAILGLVVGYLYLVSINLIWFSFICFTGFIIPLIISKIKNIGFLQQTQLYPVMSLIWLILAIFFMFSKIGIHFTAFLPQFFDPLTYELMRFSQASNEDWLSTNFALFYFFIPVLFGASVFTFFEIPVRIPIRNRRVNV